MQYEYKIEYGEMVGEVSGATTSNQSYSLHEKATLGLESNRNSDIPESLPTSISAPHGDSSTSEYSELEYVWSVTELRLMESSNSRDEIEYKGIAILGTDNASGQSREAGRQLASDNYSLQLQFAGDSVTGSGSHDVAYLNEASFSQKLKGTKTINQMVGTEWNDFSSSSKSSFTSSKIFADYEGSSDSTENASSEGSAGPEWRSLGGSFDNRSLYESDSGYLVEGIVTMENFSGPASEKKQSIIYVRSNFIGSSDGNDNLTISDATDIKSSSTLFEEKSNLQRTFTEQAPVLSVDITGTESKAINNRESSKYYWSVDSADLAQPPKITGYYQIDSFDQEKDSKKAQGTYTRKINDTEFKGEYHLAKSDTVTKTSNIYYTFEQGQGWVLGFPSLDGILGQPSHAFTLPLDLNSSESENPALNKSEFEYTYTFEFNGKGTIQPNGTEPNPIIGTANESGLIESSTSGYLNSFGTASKTSEGGNDYMLASPVRYPLTETSAAPQSQGNESTEKDRFPNLTWLTSGAMKSEDAMTFHNTGESTVVFTAGDILGQTNFEMESEFASGRTAKYDWDSAQDDWVQIYGRGVERSNAVSESETTAEGSVSQGNLDGIVVNGSFGRFESESERNDLYQADSKEWLSTGVRSEKSVSRSASTVRLSGIEEMSSGPARFNADVTVSYKSKQLGANFKQEELHVVREAFPNGAQRELTQADWIQVSGEEINASDSSSSYNVNGSGVYSEQFDDTLMMGQGHIFQQVDTQTASYKIRSFDRHSGSWVESTFDITDYDARMEQGNDGSGGYSYNVGGGSVNGTIRRSDSLSSTFSYRDARRSDTATVPSTGNPSANAFPIPPALVDIVAAGEDFLSEIPDLEEDFDSSHAQIGNEGHLSIAYAMSNNFETSGVGSFTADFGGQGNGNIAEFGSTGMQATFFLASQKDSSGAWVNSDGHQSITTSSITDYRQTFTGDWSKGDGLYDLNGGMSWSNSNRVENSTSIERNLVDGQWIGSSTIYYSLNEQRSDKYNGTGNYKHISGGLEVSGTATNSKEVLSSNKQSLTRQYDDSGNLVLAVGSGVSRWSISEDWSRNGSGGRKETVKDDENNTNSSFRLSYTEDESSSNQQTEQTTYAVVDGNLIPVYKEYWTIGDYHYLSDASTNSSFSMIVDNKVRKANHSSSGSSSHSIESTRSQNDYRLVPMTNAFASIVIYGGHSSYSDTRSSAAERSIDNADKSDDVVTGRYWERYKYTTRDTMQSGYTVMPDGTQVPFSNANGSADGYFRMKATVNGVEEASADIDLPEMRDKTYSYNKPASPSSGAATSSPNAATSESNSSVAPLPYTGSIDRHGVRPPTGVGPVESKVQQHEGERTLSAGEAEPNASPLSLVGSIAYGMGQTVGNLVNMFGAVTSGIANSLEGSPDSSETSDDDGDNNESEDDSDGPSIIPVIIDVFADIIGGPFKWVSVISGASQIIMTIGMEAVMFGQNDGHHIVPRELWGLFGFNEEVATEIFDDQEKARIFPKPGVGNEHNLTAHGRTHGYTAHVTDEMNKELKKFMTPDEKLNGMSKERQREFALKFREHIRNMPETSYIRKFNEKFRNEGLAGQKWMKEHMDDFPSPTGGGPNFNATSGEVKIRLKSKTVNLPGGRVARVLPLVGFLFTYDSLKAEGASDAEALARAALDEVIPAEDVHDFLEYVGSFYGAGMDWAIENNISDSRHLDDLDLLLRRRGSKTIYPPNE